MLPQSADVAQVSAASILARAFDDADPANAAGPYDPVPDGDPRDAPGVRARVAQASARQHMDADEAEQLASAPAVAAGPFEIEAPAPLSEVERALRNMREQMEAAASLAEAAAPVSPSPAASSPGAAPAQASTEAIANLGVDLARLVQVMDCGFDRIEATSARRMLELRTEVAQMFEELVARIDNSEQPSADPSTDGPDERTPEVTAHDPVHPAAATADVASLGWPDDADGEALTWAPPASPLVPPSAVDGSPQTQAVDDPDVELFEAQPKPDGVDRRAPFAADTADPGQTLAWSPSDAAAPSAAAFPQPLATDDPDADLFDPSPAESASHGWTLGDASAGAADWPATHAPEPAAEASGDDEVWFGQGRREAWSELGSDGPDAGHEEIAVTQFDPFERAASEAAGRRASGEKRARFPWLHLPGRGQARKIA